MTNKQYIERLRNRAKYSREEAKREPPSIAARCLAHAEVYEEVAVELSAIEHWKGDVSLSDRVYPNRTYSLKDIKKWVPMDFKRDVKEEEDNG